MFSVQISPRIIIVILCVGFLGVSGAAIFIQQNSRQIPKLVDNTSSKKTVADELAPAIPKSFPIDVPTYPNATVTSSLSDDQVSAPIDAWLTISTPDSVSSVSAYFQKELKIQNWTVNTIQKTQRGFIITATKDSRITTITVESSTKSLDANILIFVQKNIQLP